MILSENILEKVQSIIILGNTSGEVLYVNPFFLNIVGINTAEYENLSETEKRQLTVRAMGRLLLKIQVYKQRKNFEEIQFVHGFRNLKNSQKWIQCAVSTTAQNQILLTGSDITKQKTNELSVIEKHAALLLQNKEHFESLTYAQRLQEAILPDLTGKVKYAQSGMVFYRPKDVVSGDFYWTNENENGNYIAAIDCTGHGIPGAMLTVMANTLLREVIINRKIASPAKILETLDEMLALLFKKENGGIGINDGFDIALIRIEKNKVTYSGAFRPLVLVSDNEISEIQANRFPIGYFFGIEKKFDEYEFLPKAGDRLYLFSDGFTDQFGGSENKKFTKKKFKELLLSMANLRIDEQRNYLSYAFSNWKQKNEQTDDVLVIGVEF